MEDCITPSVPGARKFSGIRFCNVCHTQTHDTGAAKMELLVLLTL